MIRASRGNVLLLVFLDLLIVSAAFAAAYSLRFRFGILAVVDVEAPGVVNYVRALAVMTAVFLLVFRARGLYEVLPPRGIDVLERTVGAVTAGLVVVLAASFFYREFSYSRSVCVLAWILMCALVPIPRLGLLSARRRNYARGRGLLPALVVGTTPAALELVRRLSNHRRFGLEVKGVVRTSADTIPEGIPVLGSLETFEQVVADAGVSEVLIPDTLERLELFGVLETCGRRGIEARIVPRIYDLFVRDGDLSELYGVPFVAAREERMGLVSLAIKRSFDFVVGGLLLVIFAPLIGLLTVLVRRESPGPGLFVQQRIGQGGEAFDMWKLRSMVVDAQERLSDVIDLENLAEPVYKIADDPRISGPVGRVLRRWSLDELPQLWNVVRGDMSLVGPRPEVAEVVAHYDAHQRRRLKAKPGVTGLQQVEARGSLELDERIALDVYYIRRRSFLFDLYLLLRTPWAVLSGRGAT